MLRDQLEILLERLAKVRKHGIPKSTLRLIRRLHKKSQSIANRAREEIARKEPDSYYEMGARLLINGLWRVTGVNSEQVPWFEMIPPKKILLNENVSDHCISEITSLRNPSCRVTEDCWIKMTRLGDKGYGLTHQVLYLVTGLMLGCGPEMERYAQLHYQGSTESLLKIFCTNVIRDAEEVARDAFPARKHDEFLEEVAVCGMLGYRELANPEWIKIALTWQREDGCFTLRKAGSSRTRKRSASSRKRSKREERVLDDGCSLHMTSVGAAAFAVVNRILLLS